MTPVTVTDCGVNQFAEVNVNVVGETVASPVSPLVMATTTSVAGPDVRTTVKSSVVPDSSTMVDPSVAVRLIPAASLSVVVTSTV